MAVPDSFPPTEAIRVMTLEFQGGRPNTGYMTNLST